MSLQISRSSNRVVRARASKLFKPKPVRTIGGLLAAICFLFGVALLVAKYPTGWLLFIVPVIVLMLHEWWRHDLQDISPVTTSDKPEDVVSVDVLAVWNKPNPSDAEFIDILAKSGSFWFLGNRIGLTPEFLKQADASQEAWWTKALELWQQYPTAAGVTASHMAAAMLLVSKNKSQLLSAANAKEEDVLAGLNWFAYVQELIASVSSRQSSGGIARDWAAGYTPLLDNFAKNISWSVQYGGAMHRSIFGHQNVIDQLNIIFSSQGRANCALVGDVGVGKNMCMQAFADSLLQKTAPLKIRYSQMHQIDMASMLTKVPADQLEYSIQRLCVEAHAAKNIMLYFDNAGAFFGMDGSPDITNIMLPIIEAGNVRMIFSFTQNQWQYVQRTKSALAAVLNYQAVNATDESDTIKILENQALFTESQYKCLFTYKALKEVYRLADRYGPEIAMPGRAVSVLEDVARNNQSGLVTNINVQQSIEKTTGIKIATAGVSERNTLLNLENELHKRVIGQNAAVKEIVSALKRSRTGVGNPDKPIGTFLFLGPTGVGKTEMSKTLASAYFGGESGMVRVDMNEYITQDSIQRLLASGTDSGISFLDTIRKKPFSVVLFDEIEKAHPDIVNVLLQLLDEGTIRDKDNRVVSFKDAIIIATSNAGADIIRQQISSGESAEDLAQHLSDDLINQGIFKPEFVNRFDEVIIFSPLSQDELQLVVGVLLKGINQQLANQGITVELSDEAISWLASQGYDERLGARPLRRMMQKTVETAVSTILLEKEAPSGSVIKLDADDLKRSFENS